MECELDGATIYYEQYGEGKPIVMLHGRPSDHRHLVVDFEPYFSRRPGWRRIYPDMPGMGQTRAPEWLTNQDQMLDVLLAFSDRVIPEQPFTLVGASYGGYLAEGVIYRRGEKVDGALFLAPYLGRDETATLPGHVTLVEDKEALSALDEEEAEVVRQLAVVQSRDFVDFLDQAIMPAVEIADHQFLGRLSEQGEYSFDVRQLPQPFDKPALFLLGRQDSVVGYRAAWNVVEQYPRASFVVLDRAGHALNIEQKQLFWPLVDEWLDRVEESQAARRGQRKPIP